MKTHKIYPALALVALFSIFQSCNKETDLASTSFNASDIAAAGAIAVGTTASINSSGTTLSDSLYVVNCYGRKQKRDTVSFSSLPAAIGTYLTANYTGYIFKKAHKITDAHRL